MTKYVYLKILLKVAILDATRLYGKGFVFQQDNDPKHTAIVVKEALKEKKKRKVLKVIIWPPRSPDLSPIELYWAKLESGRGPTLPTSADDLMTILKLEWAELGSSFIERLTCHMLSVFRAVIAAKSGHIDVKNVSRDLGTP